MMADQDERRGHKRVPLDAAVDFRRAKEHRYAVRLHDLTASGCRIELPEHVSNPDTIWVTLPGLETMQSTVRWEGEWVAGVEFVRPMHPAVFDHVVARLA